MYKVKLKKGQTTRIKDDRRAGINVTIKHGEEYPQELLKRLHDAGFTNIVSKTKAKTKTKDEENETND